MKSKAFFMFAVLFLVMLTAAGASAEKTYTVRKGDSLYRISKKFRTNVHSISEANRLDSDKLVPGTKLIIPSKGRKAAVKTVDVPLQSGHALTELNPEHLLLLDQLAATDIENAQPPMQDGPVASTIESHPNGFKDFLISIARQTLGIPYRFGSNTFMRTDCSGYVQNVFSLMGVQLPRSAREQFNIGEAVDRKALSLGDLVFFRTYAPFPSHVGIYLGNNLFIHASTFAKKVTIDSLNMPYYVKRFLGAKRLPVPEPDLTVLSGPSGQDFQ